MNKIISYTNEKEQLGKLHGKKIVLAGGCFDILHFGHVSFLEKARQEGDILIIALEPDEFIRGRKHKEPIHTQSQRAQILSHLDLVDSVVLLPFFSKNEDYYELVQTIHPAVIACTKGDPNLVYKEEQAKTVRGRVAIINVFEGFSSSAIQHYAALSSD